MVPMFSAPKTPAQTVRGWRYLLDAKAAAGTELAVGLDLTDSGEQVTVRIRHSILVVDDGIADDCHAVLRLTAADLAGDTDVTTVAGDHRPGPP